MEKKKIWKVEGSFSLNYAMFELVTLVFLCFIFLANYWKAALYFLFIIITFFFLEFNMHTTIDQMISNHDFTISYGSFLFKGIFVFFIAIYFTFSAFDKLPEELYEKGSLSFMTIYSTTSIYSLIIFLFFYTFKSICIGLKLVSIYDLKRGFFGLLYRWVIFLRTLFVTKYWLQYFSRRHDVSIIYEIEHPTFDLLHFYIALKSLYLAFLIWDLDNIRRYIKRVIYKMFELSTQHHICQVCRKGPQDLVLLKCEHTLCEECAKTLLTADPFCPFCHSVVYDGPEFSYLDGTISFSSIFCCL